MGFAAYSGRCGAKKLDKLKCQYCVGLKRFDRQRQGRHTSRTVVANSDLLAQDRSPTGATAWAQLINALQQADVKMLKAQEVAFCVEKGMVLIDVRTEDQFQKGFIEGATNVPLYRMIQGWEPFKIARRIAFAAFGVLKGTEPNPDFLDEVANIATKDTGIVLCCNVGGELTAPESGAPSMQSRSLVAAYELLKDGYSPIRILQDGVNGWRSSGRDLWVVDDDPTVLGDNA
jgi:rhodanese-related sulfurtransferase